MRDDDFYELVTRMAALEARIEDLEEGRHNPRECDICNDGGQCYRAAAEKPGRES